METETVERTQQSAPSQSNAVALATTERKPVGLVDFGQFKTAAEVFIKSGYFDAALGKASPEVMMARAQVKLAVGAEIGLPPFLSLQGIYWMDIEGYAPVLMKGAQVCSFVLARSSKYRYTTTREDAEAVTIEFEEVRDGKWVKVYTSTYTMEMAAKGGLAQKKNWLKNPIKMMWNRALVTGANHIAADELNGPAGEPDDMTSGEFQEVGDRPLLPEEPIVPAKPTPEIVASSPTTVAAPEKPKRKSKAEPTKPVEADPGPSDSEILDSAEPDDEGLICHHSDEMPPDPDDISNQVITPEQMQDAQFWHLSEKFDMSAAVHKHGWIVKKLSELTQGQFHELKEDRDAYIRECGEAFGWKDLGPDLATTEAHRKQLIERQQRNMRRA